MTSADPFLLASVREFRVYKHLGERAADQVDDGELVRSPDAEGNSIAVIMRHMAGNMRSRWTDFLTTDGEKLDRARDEEFVLPVGALRQDVLASWEAGWSALFSVLESLSDEDLARTVTIRGVAHLVPEAIQRQLAHYAYHVGQIVLLARHWAGPSWVSLSVPKGQSEQWNRERWGKGSDAGSGGAAALRVLPAQRGFAL